MSFADTARRCHLPLAAWLHRQAQPGRGTILCGISGGQGTGKTTLAEFLAGWLECGGRRRSLVLSLDDFYLGRDERAALARDVHPLLKVRGVPGTHDIAMLEETLARLRAPRQQSTLTLPVFDKASDDRSRASREVELPVDIVLFEGWCVGVPPEDDRALDTPVNALERSDDVDGRWRQYVNEKLRSTYAGVFAALDKLVFLKAPGFDAILRWRTRQERQLRARRAGDAVMSDADVARFVAHYERLTRWSMRRLPDLADVLVELDERQRCRSISWR